MDLPVFSVVSVRRRVCAPKLWTCTSSTFAPYQKCHIKGHSSTWQTEAGETLLVKTEAKVALSTPARCH